jgi:hypothetical protein
VAFEHRVLVHVDRQVQVARRAARAAGVSAAADPELHPVGDARRDVDRHDRPGGDATPAVTAFTRRDDLLPCPLAGVTRVRGHDGPEDAPADVLHLAGPAARVAPLRRCPGLRAAALADLAGLHPPDLDLAPRAERGLLEPEPQVGEQVLTRLGAAPATAAATPERPRPEERLEQIGDVAERRLHRPAVAVRVVAGPPVGVREDLVRAGDLLEALLGFGVVVHVGVELAGKAPVRRADVLDRGVAPDAEDLVEIADGGHPVRRRARSRARRGAARRRGPTPSRRRSPSPSAPPRRPHRSRWIQPGTAPTRSMPPSRPCAGARRRS